MQITARPQRSCKFTFISYSLTGSLFETLGWQSRSFCVLYCMVATGGFSILLRSMNLWQPHRDSGGRKKTLNRVTMFVQWPGGFRNRLYNVPSNFTRSCLQNNDVLLPRCKTNHRSDHVKVLQSFFSPTISFRPMTQWKVSNMTCHVDIAINVIVSFPRICYWQSQLSRTWILTQYNLFVLWLAWSDHEVYHVGLHRPKGRYRIAFQAFEDIYQYTSEWRSWWDRILPGILDCITGFEIWCFEKKAWPPNLWHF